MIAEQFGKGPVHEVKAVVYRRPPHDMLGSDGYSLVSNYFLRRVLPYCLMHNIRFGRPSGGGEGEAVLSRREPELAKHEHGQ
ncbi:hypothetical protein ACF05L_20180 [Streptomyces bobili]|uniref:hypothetical protein n=1 Tax=Streptomyces bobili TaxID=67280 RepID=UPI0036FCBA41